MEQELQSISRVVFPDWYRSFLQYANGLSLYYGAISLYGLQKVERSNPEWESPSSLYLENLSRHKHVPKEWLFIGCYCYDGTEIVIDTNKEESDIFCVLLYPFAYLLSDSATTHLLPLFLFWAN